LLDSGYYIIPNNSAPSHSEEAKPVPVPRTTTPYFSKDAQINQKQQLPVDESSQES